MGKKIKKVTTTITEEYLETSSLEWTHIICILDRSGSMSNIIDDSIGGFNTFLEEQKKLTDKATITVALFDDKYDLIYDNVDITKAEELTKDIWMPRGTTSLYDAIGKTINSEKEKISNLGNEKPSKVLVCIVTDGHENNSKEYNLENVKNLIKNSEKNDWNFIYLAANQDAMTVGDSFGISKGNTFTYTTNSTGVADMSQILNSATVNYRSMSSSNSNFSDISKTLISNIDDKKEE